MSLLAKMLNPDYIKNHTKIIILVLLLYSLGLLSGFMFLVFLFTGSYTVVDFGLRTREALLLDGFLSLIFFLQHSIMVRRGFKKWLGKFMPEMYHAACYGMASAITLLMVLIFWQKTSILAAHAEGMVFALMRALFLLCLTGFFWAVKSIDSLDVLGVDVLMGRKPDKPQKIVARGPYRWSRHPIYLFVIILIWACPVLTLDRLIFNILWSLWILIGTFLEDRDLHKEFGSQYLEYSSRVPMLIPYRIPKK